MLINQPGYQVVKKITLSDKLKTERNALEENQELLNFIDGSNHLLLVLNEHDSIISANKAFAQLLGLKSIDSIIGTKLYKLINHYSLSNNKPEPADDTNSQDSIIKKLLTASKITKSEVKDNCRISINGNIFLDSILTARPLFIKKHNFTMLHIVDVSEKKWKETLEKLFIHDILNSAGALKECLNLLDLTDEKESAELLTISRTITANMIDEIISHNQFLLTEMNEYRPEITTFDCNEVLKDISGKAKYSLLTGDKSLQIFKKSDKIFISSDKTILSRVIFNLVKNALEATRKNGTVELYCTPKDDNIEFIIRNINVIPQEVQSQIFNKSFSTKGSGRGLGTYGAKLLTERLLKGKLFFESNDPLGTIFYAVFPVSI